ncbi:MAG: TetR family transcriptional regulator [Gammaproteobacteria bacterium]|nr:TetR family transcriptional regulator [Gammaproteobacteria bacterium]
MKDKKEITREVNRKKIIQAAENVFANYGFKGATTEKIAKQAGLPKANLHYYFNTKTILYREVLEGILEEWMVAAQTFDKYDEPKIALTRYIEAKMNFSRIRADASKVWANEVIQGAVSVSKFLETTLKEWLENRVKVINDWIAGGKIEAVDPYVLFYMIWSMTQHYADFERQIAILNHGKHYNDDEFQQKTEQVVHLILKSVGLS